MEQQNNEQRSVELSPQLVSIMTTEHYTLQTGRSMTTAEANGRSTLFVGAVSSGLIALTFVGQIAHLGTAFFVFSLVVIPTLLFMGLLTFERVLQAGSVDIIYAQGINRIRHLYLEYAPQVQTYFILSTHDDREGTLSHEAMLTSWRQVFFNTAGMIAVITSMLAGSFVGLLLAAFTFPLWVCTGAGVLTFLLSVALLQRYQWRQKMHLARTMPVLFPSQPGEEKPKEVLEEEKQSFVQYYGSDAVDASSLLLMITNFTGSMEPRMLSTIRRIQQELASGALVHRYNPQNAANDGLGSSAPARNQCRLARRPAQADDRSSQAFE